MKIFELYTQKMNRDEFDLNDDLIFFINNDPEFYRKDYYPFIRRFKNHCDHDKEVKVSAFVPIVKKAFSHYQNTFPVQGLESKLKEDDLQEICEKLHGQEMEHYQNEKKKSTENKDDTKRTF